MLDLSDRYTLKCVKNYDMKCEAYVAGIDLPVITEKATFDRKYEGVAKYPAVNRDLSLVMKKKFS